MGKENRLGDRATVPFDAFHLLRTGDRARKSLSREVSKSFLIMTRTPSIFFLSPPWERTEVRGNIQRRGAL